MTRAELLQTAYDHYDQIYAALILAAVWVAGTGHLVDAITTGRSRVALPIYWGFIILAFFVSVILLGLYIS